MLSELSAKNDLNESLVFAGRDGIGVYQAAQALLTKQPQNYPNVTPSQLAYAYLTRKLVWDTPPEKLKDYMEQLGVTDYAKMTLVDIGMYGTILPELEKALPGFTANNTQYLISRTSAVDGFLDNGGTKKLPVFEQIIGNPVIHFLEDTFSGPIHSPTMLVESDEGILEPDTRDEGYSMDIAIKREFALRGIVDFVSESDLTSLDPEKAGEELNNFLSFPENFRSIMIPHER